MHVPLLQSGTAAASETMEKGSPNTQEIVSAVTAHVSVDMQMHVHNVILHRCIHS